MKQEQPSGGDVFVSDHSVIHHRNLARAEQGVCPQFNAIDTHLTGEALHSASCCTKRMMLT
jgi:ABC-type multidrug transport system ATPase subunit